MRNFALVFLLAVVFSGIVRAQKKFPVQNDVITRLFDRLSESGSDAERQRINDSINTFAREYAASDSVFDFNYEARYLGQITSPDSLLKIITWNLLLESGKNRYSCYIVRKAGRNQRNNIYQLGGEHRNDPVLTDTIYSLSDWYGALYYDIRPFPGEKNNWMVLGLDYGNSDASRKIIDVISFTGDAPPVFGKKVFQTAGGMKYRQVFEYSSIGSMTLRFSSDSSIVFDHLVPISASTEGGKMLMGPDFSYDAFVLQNGKWIFRLNIDARNKE